jgi:Ion channel
MMHSTDRAEDAVDKPAQDLFLLFSILLLILVHPFLDGVIWGRATLGLLTFVPLITAMIRMSRKKGLVWPFAALIGAAFLCAIVAYISGNQTVLAIQFLLATIAFAVSVMGLFSYLFGATRITAGHLYTAGSIYLLLVMLFFALYSCISAIHPDAFEKTTSGTTGTTGNAIDLLYFSMCTLTTVGYGDIVPVRPMARMLAGLEATTGVLYVAITVSLLVSGYKARPRS